MNKKNRRASIMLMLTSFLFQFFSPFLIYASETVTPTPTPEVTVTPTIEEVITPSPTPELTIEETITPTPTPEVTVTPTIEEVVTPTPTPTPDSSLVTTIKEPETSVSSANVADPVWVDNQDGSVTTFSTVGEGVEYQFKDTQVKITFTKLTTQGYLTIREFTPENANQLGIVGNAYEITSDMEDGTFEYNLTLPAPNESPDNLSVKYSETSDELSNAQVVDQPAELGENTITINGLDHFTVFVVVNPNTDGNGNACTVASITGTCYDTLQEAIVNAVSGDTIELASDITVASRVDINTAITLDGNGNTIFASFAKTGNSNNAALGIFGDGATIQHLTVDGTGSQAYPLHLHGINIYEATNVSIDNVTTVNFSASGIVVNSSTVTVNDVSTSGNGWHGINVDQKTSSPSVLTVTGNSSHGDAAHIYIDDSTLDVTLNDTLGQYSVSNPVVNGNTNDRLYTHKDIIAPPVPTLVGPANGSYFNSHTFTADWVDVIDNKSGLLNYDIQFYYGGSWRDLRTITPSQRTNSASYDLTWQWHVRSRDNTGNVSDWSDPWTVTLDTTKPVMSSYGISDTLLNASENTVTLFGNISDDTSPIDSVKYSIWNSAKTILYANWTNTDAADGTYDSKNESTNHVIDVSSFPDDTFILGVRGWDKAGNKASGGDFYFTIDNTAPTTPTITSPVAESYLNSTPIPNQWTSVADSSGIDYYRIQYEYDDLHTFSGYPYRTTSATSRNHVPGIGEQGGVKFRVQAFDNAGNEGAWSNWRHYYYDATPPSIPVLTWPTGGLFTNDNTPLMQWGDSTDNLGVAGYLYRIYYNCSDPNDQSTCSSLYPSTLGLWLTNSEYQAGPTRDNTFLWQVQSQDLAANQSGWSGHEQFTIDTVAPPQPTGLKLLSADESTDYQCGAIIPRQINIPVWDEYTGSDFDHYEYSSFHPSGAQGLNEKILYTPKLANSWLPPTDGAHGFSVRTVDKAGNESPWSLSGETLGGSCQIIYDSVAPVVQITNPFAGLVTGSVDIRGTVTDVNPHHYWLVVQNSGGSTVAGPGVVNDTNSFTDKIFFTWDTTSVPTGTYTIILHARDSANNKDAGSMTEVDVIVDNDAPVSTINTPTGPDFFNSTITIAGNTTDNVGLASVELSYAPYTDVCGTYLPITTPITLSGTSDNWTHDWTPAEGDYCIKAAGTDQAGNVESSAIVSNIIFDTTSPTVNWTTPQDGDTLVGTSQVLSSNSDALAGLYSVHYEYKKTSEVGYTSISFLTSNFNNSVAWDTSLLDLDTYHLRLTVTDNAGNETVIVREIGVAAIVSSQFSTTPSFGTATVSWTTDRPTTGRVVYDIVPHAAIDMSHPNYGYAYTTGTFDTSPKTTSHSISISGLSDTTPYYYRVISTGSPTSIGVEGGWKTLSMAGPGGSTTPSTGGTGATTTLVTSTPSLPTGSTLGLSDTPEEEVVIEEEEAPTSEEVVTAEQIDEPEVLGTTTNKSKTWLWILLGLFSTTGFFWLLIFKKKKPEDK